MQVAPLPQEESRRQQTLVDYRILDTPPEVAFDDCARMAAELCQTDIGAVTLLDRERQWLKAVHGSMARQTTRRDSFCSHTILQPGLLEVPDAWKDPRFSDNPLVEGAPHIRFYAGVPLVASNGLPLGSVCVIHPKPHRLTDPQRRGLLACGAQMAAQLELRLALLQMREAQQLAQQRLEALQRANMRQRELSEFIVHDLKNPLAAISASGNHLKSDSSIGTRQRAAAHQIVNAAEVMHRMVLDLLDLERAEAGTLPIRRLVFGLDELARAQLDAAKPLANERAQRLQLRVPADLTPVWADPSLTARILTNLLDNALTYSPPGATIRVELSPEGPWVALRVRDEGPGVPPSQRMAIFDKHFQLETANPVRAGHGVGLAFCRLAVLAQGGTIELEDVERGCCFRVTLPTSPDPELG